MKTIAELQAELAELRNPCLSLSSETESLRRSFQAENDRKAERPSIQHSQEIAKLPGELESSENSLQHLQGHVADVKHHHAEQSLERDRRLTQVQNYRVNLHAQMEG